MSRNSCSVLSKLFIRYKPARGSIDRSEAAAAQMSRNSCSVLSKLFIRCKPAQGSIDRSQASAAKMSGYIRNSRSVLSKLFIHYKPARGSIDQSEAAAAQMSRKSCSVLSKLFIHCKPAQGSIDRSQAAEAEMSGYIRNWRSVVSKLFIRYKPAHGSIDRSQAAAVAKMSSYMRSSRSVLAELFVRYKPAQPPLTRRYRNPAPPLPAACPQSQPPTNLARGWYREPRKVAAALLLPCAAVFLFPHAKTFAVYYASSHEEAVPYTNRIHRVVISPSDERKHGVLAFEKIKEMQGDNVLGPSDPSTIRVRRLASDIIGGIHRVLLTKSPCNGEDNDGGSPLKDPAGPAPNGGSNKQQGKMAVLPQTAHLGELNWEVIVIKDKRITAYHVLGGKIIIHAGLLDCLDSDAEIATILAHEVGHIVARHFVEIGRCIPFLYELLPFSRRSELEADLLGLMLLAAGGFDPRVAPGVYKKLGEAKGDGPWRDYISSHPSYRTRSRLLSQGKVMGEALELYHRQVRAREGVD